ncbi:MAG: sigma-70 family RNA polymerase sigma factor [Myxococcota bacterium]
MGREAREAAEKIRHQLAVVASALAGERDAMEQLIALVAPYIQIRAARYLASRTTGFGSGLRAEQDDLVQEVFLRLLVNDGRALRAWRPERGLDLGSFVGLIAQREILNVMRSARRRPWTDADPLPSTLKAHCPVEEQAIEGDLVRRLLYGLHRWLTPRGRELFQVVYVEERPLEEVASQFGMKRGALYAWRSRVQARARTLLDELEREEAPAPKGFGKSAHVRSR